MLSLEYTSSFWCLYSTLFLLFHPIIFRIFTSQLPFAFNYFFDSRLSTSVGTIFYTVAFPCNEPLYTALFCLEDTKFPLPIACARVERICLSIFLSSVAIHLGSVVRCKFVLTCNLCKLKVWCASLVFVFVRSI